MAQNSVTTCLLLLTYLSRTCDPFDIPDPRAPFCHVQNGMYTSAVQCPFGSHILTAPSHLRP